MAVTKGCMSVQAASSPVWSKGLNSYIIRVKKQVRQPAFFIRTPGARSGEVLPRIDSYEKHYNQEITRNSIRKNIPLSQINAPVPKAAASRFSLSRSTFLHRDTITQISNTIVPKVALSG